MDPSEDAEVKNSMNNMSSLIKHTHAKIVPCENSENRKTVFCNDVLSCVFIKQTFKILTLLCVSVPFFPVLSCPIHS